MESRALNNHQCPCVVSVGDLKAKVKGRHVCLDHGFVVCNLVEPRVVNLARSPPIPIQEQAADLSSVFTPDYLFDSEYLSSLRSASAWFQNLDRIAFGRFQERFDEGIKVDFSATLKHCPLFCSGSFQAK
jgi:hypothetical protein